MTSQTVFAKRFALAIFLLFCTFVVCGQKVSFKGGDNDEFRVSFNVKKMNNTFDSCPPNCPAAKLDYNVISLVAFVLVNLVFLLLAIDYVIILVCPHWLGTSDSADDSDSGDVVELQLISVKVHSEKGEEDAEKEPLTEEMSDSPV